jgi:2-dehydropantoate 2-reductase
VVRERSQEHSERLQSTILIWGAGAIGGTVGAFLARAGHSVLFVDIDADHVAAINERGLTIEGPIDRFNVAANACLPADVGGVHDRVFLCVKAHHTAAAMTCLARHVATGGYVASLQNGLNFDVIAPIVSAARTIAAFINFGADYLSPGCVHFGGRGAVAVGEIDGRRTARIVALRQLLQAFEPAAAISDNILGYLWGKLGYGALLFATALTDASICAALAAPQARRLYRQIAAETVVVARALSIQPLGFDGYHPEAFEAGAPWTAAEASLAEMVAHNARSAKTHSGIWRDLAIRKRPTEVDAQLGPIVRFGEQYQVDTPVIRRLIAMIHEVELGKRPLAWENLDELGQEAESNAP